MLFPPPPSSVSLQMFTVGAQLQIAPRANPGVKPTAFVLFVRFVVMPAISIGLVYATAGRGIYEDDPLIWFVFFFFWSDRAEEFWELIC
jgi:auxin efflux carrier family protein